MEDAVALLQRHNSFEHVCPSGMRVKFHLPRLRDCLIAGQIPTPVLREMVLEDVAEEAANGNGTPAEPPRTEPKPEQSQEDKARAVVKTVAMGRYHDEIVCRMVDEIDGKPVKLDHEAVALMHPEDYEELVAIGTRLMPIPKAGAEASAEETPST